MQAHAGINEAIYRSGNTAEMGRAQRLREDGKPILAPQRPDFSIKTAPGLARLCPPSVEQGLLHSRGTPGIVSRSQPTVLRRIGAQAHGQGSGKASCAAWRDEAVSRSSIHSDIPGWPISRRTKLLRQTMIWWPHFAIRISLWQATLLFPICFRQRSKKKFESFSEV